MSMTGPNTWQRKKMHLLGPTFLSPRRSLTLSPREPAGPPGPGKPAGP